MVVVGTGWKGNQVFPPCPQSPPCAGRLACARTCVCLRVRGFRHAWEPALSCVLPPPLSQDPPCWLVTTAATDCMGRHLDQMSYGAKKCTLSALRLEADIFHVLYLGEGHFGVYIGFQQSWKRSCKSNRDRLMICNQGFLGVWSNTLEGAWGKGECNYISFGWRGLTDVRNIFDQQLSWHCLWWNPQPWRLAE